MIVVFSFYCLSIVALSLKLYHNIFILSSNRLMRTKVSLRSVPVPLNKKRQTKRYAFFVGAPEMSIYELNLSHLRESAPITKT